MDMIQKMENIFKTEGPLSILEAERLAGFPSYNPEVRKSFWKLLEQGKVRVRWDYKIEWMS